MESFGPHLPADLMALAMDAAFRTCAFWALAEPLQMRLMAAPDPGTLQRWRAGDFGGLTVRALEGACRILEYGKWLADGSLLPDRTCDWIREALDHAPFDGRCMLDFMLSEDPAKHQLLIEYVSGQRIAMTLGRVIAREMNIARSRRPFAGSSSR